MHAKLPGWLKEAQPVIATMEFGITYYVVPWAMWADHKELLWLHPDYDVRESPMGTARMRIELHQDGYHVWPVQDYYWRPEDEPEYVGGASQPYVPVAVVEEWT